MLLAAEVVHALHAALEDAQEVFDVIGGLPVLSDVIAALVLPCSTVLCAALFANLSVEAALVGVQFGLTRHVANEDFAGGFLGR